MATHLEHTTPRGVEAIVGVSPWARWIREEILRVAAYDSSVLITGPTGTGKELVARALWAHSRRARGPFVPVDCAAVPGELFASQMFGHLKGAFTGAHYAALGAFRAASGGTIFLDEVGELDPVVQAKLLRVIQERVVVPLGSHEGEPVDVRIIAATNRDLEAEVRQGRFREDLFYRLNVISLATLPLCQRREDIEVLARHCLCKLAIEAGLPLKRLSAAAVQLLTAYDWPGQVRELNNQLERAAIHTPGDVLGPESLGELLAAMRRRWDERAGASVRGQNAEDPRAHDRLADGREDKPGWPTLAQIEREHILETLRQTGFNQCAAARLLHVDRHALRRKIRKYGLDVAPSRRGRPSGRSAST